MGGGSAVDLLLDHRQQVLVDGAGDEEQGLGGGVVDPGVRRCGLTLTAFLHERLGQSMFAPGVGCDVTVDVEYAQFVGFAPRPALGQCRCKLRRPLLLAEFGELAAQRLHLRHAVQPQQDAQFARLMRVQALNALDAQ